MARVRPEERLAMDRVNGGFLWWGTIPPDTKPRWYRVGGTVIPSSTPSAPSVTEMAVAQTTVPDGTVLLSSTGLGIVQSGAPAQITATTPPTAPPVTGLRATPGTTFVDVAWSAVASATYDVFVNGVLIVSGLATNAYRAAGLTENTAVTIGVRAVVGASVGAITNIRPQTLNAAPPAPAISVSTKPAQAVIAWTLARPSDFSRVEVYIGTTRVAVGTTSPLVWNGTGTQTFRARSVDSGGLPSAWSNSVTVTVPAAPTEKIGTAPRASSSYGGTTYALDKGVDGSTATMWVSQQYATVGGVDWYEVTCTGHVYSVRVWLPSTQNGSIQVNGLTVWSGTIVGGGWGTAVCDVPGGTAIRVNLSPVGIPGFPGLRSALAELHYTSN